MRVESVSRDGLAEDLADRCERLGELGPVAVGLDGAPSTEVLALAGAVAERLRERGRFALVVDLDDYWRPASLRLEWGREDPDAYLDGWYDYRALAREVVDPLAPGGTRRVLPVFWDRATDRSARAVPVTVPEAGVVLVAGPFLLGRWLDLALTVHCRQTATVQARRTPVDRRWTLPAFERYARDVEPETLADLVVRMNDPARPAVER